VGELSRFPELRERLFEIVNQLLRNCVAPTQKMISNLVQIELAYINTAHPDFIGGKLALGKVPLKKDPSTAANPGTTLYFPTRRVFFPQILLDPAATGGSTEAALPPVSSGNGQPAGVSQNPASVKPPMNAAPLVGTGGYTS